ncbi:metallophosphoesterase [Haloarcula salinisoli]|uniref:Metallophosphoesterase family protein n=1 Tax=Haloarcula salinisoli TaxID=2487746 RepID=A0A8J8C909_9EURY|nr:metallophosphoesterase [Halomicroarcula salinisoli]MBX0303719.1 metallophosphoesterase family protein [Halomicroarcula salinisoli]
MTDQQDILVMGDNHGDVDSLDQVIADTQGEQFDFIIHVGDLTNTWFDGIETGVEQLQSVESRLVDLAERANEDLLYIYGNRDHTRGPESEYVYERYELDVGTHIPIDGGITISGQRFTQDPELVSEDDILVTHGECVPMLDHFDGRAYFSGHEHTGRYKGPCLNSAFLYRTDDHGGEPLIGGYFVVTVDDEPPFEVDFRNLARLQKIMCPKHYGRGVLFAPDFHDCQFCYDGELQLMKEMAQSAFYGITHQNEQDAVSEDTLIEYAVGLYENSPSGFEDKFTQYVNELGQHPLDPLRRDDEDRLVRPTD